MGLFDKLNGMFKGGSAGGGNSIFSDLKAPAKLDLGGSYNNTVNNTGNYSLPTQNTVGTQQQAKPLGDYSFLKNSSEYVPNTDFVKDIANAKPSRFKNALAGGLEGFANGEQAGASVPEIAVNGFNYQNGQINPVEQLQRPNLYSYLIG